GVEHLEEGDAVHRHGGVVLGDHFLLGDRDYLLHHVHLAPDAVEIRRDQVEARRERAGILAETLDGPVVTLWDSLDAGEQCNDDEKRECNNENLKAAHKSSNAGRETPAPFPHHSLAERKPLLFVCRPAVPVQPALLADIRMEGLSILPDVPAAP